jgi:predicted metal-dependent phosphotriesterase family hydrolase
MEMTEAAESKNDQTKKARMQIMTVRGPIATAEAGFVLPHEHLLCDLWSISGSYDAILDDEDLIATELLYYRRAGGKTIVEVSSIGLGRNPQGLLRLSEKTGLNIVMGSGWYREKVYPAYINELSTNELADRIYQDLTRGADETNIRAGVIGEIGTERHHITPAQERVFRAAARAHKRTGAPIWTHTTHFGELALEQIALLHEEGVPSDRIVISHLGDRFGATCLLAIADKGVYLEIDNIGYQGDGYPPDSVRASNVLELIAQGYEKQLLLSLDVCMKQHLHCYGGKGYDHLQTSFLPLLKQMGVKEKQIARMTLVNTVEALSYHEQEKQTVIAKREEN